jgi:hypothetical protein
MGCGCLLALASALSPRLGIFLVWLFTDRIPRAFDGNWIFPILGFFLLPWTTLAWSVAWAPVGGVSGFGWFLVILAFLADLSTHAGAAQARRQQRSTGLV